MKYLPDILKRELSQSKFATNQNEKILSKAAILIPMVQQEDDWHLLFTRRTHFVSTHQNEVSFPGGSYEPSDLDLETTALRETREEIGITSENIEILGAMQTLNTITGFSVFPFVAILIWPVKMKINK